MYSILRLSAESNVVAVKGILVPYSLLTARSQSESIEVTIALPLYGFEIEKQNICRPNREFCCAMMNIVSFHYRSLIYPHCVGTLMLFLCGFQS